MHFSRADYGLPPAGRVSDLARASCCTMHLYAHHVLSVWTVCFYALNKNGGG